MDRKANINLLQRLPGQVPEPPGLERRILQKLPVWLSAGTAVPALCYLIAYLFPSPANDDSIEKYLTGVAIAAIATVVTVWTAAFTTAIGCLIIVVMKGPGYVADSYPLSDAEAPLKTPASKGQPPARKR